jgi:integrase
VATLREREAVAALALEFLILTAARSGEVMGMVWDEIDLTTAIWTIPAHRMKAGKEHRVPITKRAMTILETVKPLSDTKNGPKGPVFKGPRGQGLSNMAFTMLCRRMNQTGFTIHGFRSAFRDWAYEVSTFPREIAEAALAHTVGDATERAYRRGDAIEKRRLMMEAWASFIEPQTSGGNGVQFEIS